MFSQLGGLRAKWSFPPPTHSSWALDAAKASGRYWDRVGVSRRLRSRLWEPGLKLFVEDGLEPWRTVRETAGLGEPSRCGSPSNHVFQPGARSYPGHNGSPLDSPAKTLKAGDHGVPHGLRHSAATILLNHVGKDLREIQELLRRKNIRTTVRYTHVGYQHTRQTAEALSQALE